MVSCVCRGLCACALTVVVLVARLAEADGERRAKTEKRKVNLNNMSTTTSHLKTTQDKDLSRIGIARIARLHMSFGFFGGFALFLRSHRTVRSGSGSGAAAEPEAGEGSQARGARGIAPRPTSAADLQLHLRSHTGAARAPSAARRRGPAPFDSEPRTRTAHT